MVEKKVIIKNEIGIHRNVCCELVSFAYKFKDEDIWLVKENKTANAKSILNIIMLGLDCGEEMIVRVDGAKENEVLEKMVNFIEKIGN